MAKGHIVEALVPVYLVSVEVPRDNKHPQKVTDAILAHDPLQYGDGYDQVAWESAVGIERYRTLPGTNPTVGTEGYRSSIPSIKLTFMLPRGGQGRRAHLQKVLNAIVAAHPWEEPVICVSEARATRCALSA